MSPRLPILLVVSIFMFSWGWFIGPIHGLLGLSVTTLTTSAFFFFVLWLGGPHVLPLDPRKKAQASAARNLVLRFASGLLTLMAVVREARILTPDGRSRKADEGVGVIDVDSTSVVVLNTETELSRIEGPGIIFTGANERIGTVVDLRVQSRAQDAELVTRDGIHVKVRVAVRFQIDQVEPVQVQIARPAERWPMPFKWSRRVKIAVKLALDQENAELDKQIRWDDIALSVATDRLRTIVAEYTFDDLSKPLDPRANPRQVIRQELENRVRTTMAKTGIRVLGVGVGIFFPKDYDAQSPELELDSISQRRVSTWQAKWESQNLRVQAEGKAESDRRHEQARSQAQMELIRRVIQALEQSGISAADASDQITRRFLDTLDKMETESAKRKSLSEDEDLARRALRDISTQESSRDGSEPSAEPE
jgi:hypothetical protein